MDSRDMRELAGDLANLAAERGIRIGSLKLRDIDTMGELVSMAIDAQESNEVESCCDSPNVVEGICHNCTAKGKLEISIKFDSREVVLIVTDHPLEILRGYSNDEVVGILSRGLLAVHLVS